MKLQGQVALITGASHGLGLSIAHALGAAGARVACVARPGGELDAAARSLAAAGIDAMPVAADVTQASQLEGATRSILAAWGGLDIAVLNAGTWKGGPVHEMSEEAWDQLLDLNLKGAFLTLKYALPPMLSRGHGTIVGIGSLGGTVGQANASAYAASKWGLRGLLESVALEVKPRRVRVSLIHPHLMNSAGKTLPPGSPERDRAIETSEVASLVAWICALPQHVSVGNATIWPLAAGVTSF